MVAVFIIICGAGQWSDATPSGVLGKAANDIEPHLVRRAV
jgi:hypothetical protein